MSSPISVPNTSDEKYADQTYNPKERQEAKEGMSHWIQKKAESMIQSKWKDLPWSTVYEIAEAVKYQAEEEKSFFASDLDRWIVEHKRRYDKNLKEIGSLVGNEWSSTDSTLPSGRAGLRKSDTFPRTTERSSSLEFDQIEGNWLEPVGNEDLETGSTQMEDPIRRDTFPLSLSDVPPHLEFDVEAKMRWLGEHGLFK